MSKPLLLLDAYIAPEGGLPNYAPWLSRPLEAVRVPFAPVPAFDPDRWAGVVITGSRASATEPEPWMHASAELVRAALAADLPVLGCCFGHQLIAFAVEGPHAVVKAPVPEVGYLDVHLDRGDPVLDALPPVIRTFVSHEDQVVAGGQLEVLGRSELCPVHALRVKGKRAWGVQFHVEYPADEEERILWYRADKHPELALDVPAVLGLRPDTSAQARALFSSFEAVCDP